MIYTENHSQLIHQFRNYFSSQSAFLFSKGRVGLYASIRALNLAEGDVVLMPGYTCLVVPAAVMAQGLKPSYLDIDPVTYNLNPRLLDSYNSSNVRALIVQHTYGVPCDMEAVLSWGKANNAAVIEDCCLSFGSTYQDQLCGTFGLASYFSGQWNKPFSTGLGGMLAVNQAELAEQIQTIIDRELIEPSLVYRLLVWIQIQLHERLVTPSTFQLIMRLYRVVSKAGLAVGSSTSCEYRGKLHPNYFMGMTSAQAKKGVAEMLTIEANLGHRRSIAGLYESQLSDRGFAPVSVPYQASPVYVCYPVRVKNKHDLLDQAQRKGVEIGSWFESPLHPKGTDLASLQYDIGSCPEAETAAGQVITLPTHRKITPPIAERILDFIQHHAEPV